MMAAAKMASNVRSWCKNKLPSSSCEIEQKYYIIQFQIVVSSTSMKLKTKIILILILVISAIGTKYALFDFTISSGKRVGNLVKISNVASFSLTH